MDTQLGMLLVGFACLGFGIYFNHPTLHVSAHVWFAGSIIVGELTKLLK